MPFRSICLKLNVIGWQEFELFDNNAVQLFNHYTIRTPPPLSNQISRALLDILISSSYDYFPGPWWEFYHWCHRHLHVTQYLALWQNIKYLSIFLFSFSFIHWPNGTSLSTLKQVLFFFIINNWCLLLSWIAQLAGAVEYTECTSADR